MSNLRDVYIIGVGQTHVVNIQLKLLMFLDVKLHGLRLKIQVFMLEILKLDFVSMFIKEWELATKNT